ncbi:MAG: PEGA domain-containing protein [Chitinivibrionales bacterium]|nr:PEGA domain-containing protein [Chitinivibrionales bacterium]MBD3358470.1 PEGA domain-containing protein [Chitinivibrionales bacterium]
MQRVARGSRRSGIIAASIAVLLVTLHGSCIAQAGRLTVLSDPSGAKVWINDQYAGQTPIQARQLPPGHYSLRIVDPVRQITKREAVKVTADSTSVVSLALQKDYGTIVVESVPTGAEVFFTTKIGTTPLTDDQIVPGAYNVELRHPNPRYLTEYVENVVVRKNGSVTISKQLKKRRRLDGKAVVRLGLGLVCAGGAVIGGVGAANDNTGQTMFGYMLGGAALVGLEIVAFF